MSVLLTCLLSPGVAVSPIQARHLPDSGGGICDVTEHDESVRVERQVGHIRRELLPQRHHLRSRHRLRRLHRVAEPSYAGCVLDQAAATAVHLGCTARVSDTGAPMLSQSMLSCKAFGEGTSGNYYNPHKGNSHSRQLPLRLS